MLAILRTRSVPMDEAGYPRGFCQALAGAVTAFLLVPLRSSAESSKSPVVPQLPSAFLLQLSPGPPPGLVSATELSSQSRTDVPVSHRLCGSSIAISFYYGLGPTRLDAVPMNRGRRGASLHGQDGDPPSAPSKGRIEEDAYKNASSSHPV